jgi:hypothetical protein
MTYVNAGSFNIKWMNNLSERKLTYQVCGFIKYLATAQQLTDTKYEVCDFIKYLADVH